MSLTYIAEQLSIARKDPKRVRFITSVTGESPHEILFDDVKHKLDSAMAAILSCFASVSWLDHYAKIYETLSKLHGAFIENEGKFLDRLKSHSFTRRRQESISSASSTDGEVDEGSFLIFFRGDWPDEVKSIALFLQFTADVLSSDASAFNDSALVSANSFFQYALTHCKNHKLVVQRLNKTSLFEEGEAPGVELTF